VGSLAILSGGCATFTKLQATPQRPSFSADTNTTEPGTVEIEMGVAVSDEDAVNSPVAVKWGATERSELFLGWSPVVHLESAAGNETGSGDMVVGTRLRFLEESSSRPSGALQLATKLPTASDEKGLGSGEVDFSGAGILTKNIDRFTLVGYYQFGVLGDPVGPRVNTEHAMAVAVGRPVTTSLGGFAEVSGVMMPDKDSSSLFCTFGLAYSARLGLVFDTAVTLGLTDDVDDWALVLGLTANLGKAR
jgi:hypothetical protein